MISTRTITCVALGLTLMACAIAAFAADARGAEANAAASFSAPVHSQAPLRLLDRATQPAETLQPFGYLALARLTKSLV